MQYVAYESGLEVTGQATWSVVDGFKSFSVLASEFLIAEGIGVRGADGLVVVDRTGWYPMDAWLRAFRRIGEAVGEQVLYQIGRAIPRHAAFPSFPKDVPSAIQAIDIAYHMNHRKNGRVMFDADSGRMAEGIGHYGYTPAGERRIISVCDNPYPCSFDRGILTEMAQRFAPQATVTHDESKPCRRLGANSCTYVITW